LTYGLVVNIDLLYYTTSRRLSELNLYV